MRKHTKTGRLDEPMNRVSFEFDSFLKELMKLMKSAKTPYVIKRETVGALITLGSFFAGLLSSSLRAAASLAAFVMRACSSSIRIDFFSAQTLPWLVPQMVAIVLYGRPLLISVRSNSDGRVFFLPI